jgi:hypothetical protein
MNQHDLDNLRFLLTVDSETLRDWFNTVDEDDIVYATELLERAKTDVKAKVMMIDLLIDQSDEDMDLAPAADYLSKFTLRSVQ